MISHQHKCLFIHIPKVAGQSIESAFLSELQLSWEDRECLLLKKNSDPKKGPPRLAHLTSDEYLNLNYITQRDYDTYFKFSFVRNPWSRLVSEYNYKQPKMSFDQFVLNFLPKCQHDDYKQHNGIHRHLMPQVDFIYGAGTCQVDFIGKFENIQHDFNIVAKKVFGKSIALPYRNKTKNSSLISKLFNRDTAKPFQAYYTRETRHFVEQFYEKDIKEFNYHFDD
ncbi:sulfotransferase family protein [Pseudoalteromonas aurantia]|uniref:Sulfotransferase family protein n=1 Tax=Pseudoalteromonas aurantia 208 TaxID=1314867 RepID=A0ABR9EHR9_9GAMM|nr:sulfotransferase family protein [Pseudoalteromonas aurantia]MBE0369288.1 hypothetical protein [Pseudoalteromonas aurantia 208]